MLWLCIITSEVRNQSLELFEWTGPDVNDGTDDGSRWTQNVVIHVATTVLFPYNSYLKTVWGKINQMTIHQLIRRVKIC